MIDMCYILWPRNEAQFTDVSIVKAKSLLELIDFTLQGNICRKHWQDIEVEERLDSIP